MTSDSSSRSNLKFLQDIVGSGEATNSSSSLRSEDTSKSTEQSDKVFSNKSDVTMETEQQNLNSGGDNDESVVTDSLIPVGEKNKGKKKKMKKKKKNNDKLPFSGGENRQTPNNENGSVQSEPRTTSDPHAFETLSDSTDVRSKPKRRLSKRKQVNRPAINPSKAIEESIQQKYEELKVLIAKDFVCKNRELNGSELRNMEYLRQQHSNVMYGESLPSPRSASQLGYYQDERENLSNDPSYPRIRQIMVSSSHPQKPGHQRPKTAPSRRLPPPNTEQNSKLPKATKDHGSSQGSDSTNQSTPRKVIAPLDNSLKNIDNVDIADWLKKKNKLIRQQQREERKKKKEEQKQLEEKEKAKTMKKRESDAEVKEWMNRKRKEAFSERKKKLEESRVRAESAENITRRPFSAPPRRSHSTGVLNESSMTISKVLITEKTSNSESKEEIDLSQIEDPEKRRELSAKIRLEEDSKMQNEKREHIRCSSALPVRSTYLYKRPVSGKVRLKVSQKGTSSKNQPNAKKEETKEEKQKEARQSYDQWLKNKRKEDIKKKKDAEKEQEKLVSQSDPDLTKLVPDIAKKRVHTILSSKKRVNSGIRRYDRKVNKQFGGGDFTSGDDTGDEAAEKNNYRNLNEQIGSMTSEEDSNDQIEVSHKSKLVPIPKKSASPRPASAGNIKVHTAMSVNTGPDHENPFQLPFPPDLGVPKHVLEKQKKLFSQAAFDETQPEERPEPQGSDSPEHKIQCPKSLTSKCVTGNTVTDQQDEVKSLTNKVVTGFVVTDQLDAVDSWDGIVTDNKQMKANIIDDEHTNISEKIISHKEPSDMFTDSIDSLLEDKSDIVSSSNEIIKHDEQDTEEEIEEEITPYEKEADLFFDDGIDIQHSSTKIEQSKLISDQNVENEEFSEVTSSREQESDNAVLIKEDHPSNEFTKDSHTESTKTESEENVSDDSVFTNDENFQQVPFNSEYVPLSDSIPAELNNSQTTPVVLKSLIKKPVEYTDDTQTIETSQQETSVSGQSDRSLDSDKLRKSVTFSETPPKVKLYESTEVEDNNPRHIPSFFNAYDDDEMDVYDDMYMYDGFYNYMSDNGENFNMNPEDVRNMIESIVQKSFEQNKNGENTTDENNGNTEEYTQHKDSVGLGMTTNSGTDDNQTPTDLDTKVPSLNLTFDDDIPNAEKTFLTSSDDPHDI